MRHFVHIGYKGTRYAGWQRQPGVITVQEVIETALNRILKIPLVVYGCGRTDSGVHASQYFFHIDLEEPLEFDLKFRLNQVLPDDIAVFDVIAVDGLPHARFHATERTYDFFIHTYKDPFLSDFSSLYLNRELDPSKMRDAAKLLIDYQDYRSYCKSPDKNKHTLCLITEARIFVNPTENRIKFRISSNRFLARMVRILARKLIEIGEGTLSVDEFENHLLTRNIPQKILPAHPQGLFLSRVRYPFLAIEENTTFFAPISNGISYWKEV